MKKLLLFALGLALIPVIYAVIYDVYEYLWSRYGVMPMRKIK